MQYPIYILCLLFIQLSVIYSDLYYDYLTPADLYLQKSLTERHIFFNYKYSYNQQVNLYSQARKIATDSTLLPTGNFASAGSKQISHQHFLELTYIPRYYLGLHLNIPFISYTYDAQIANSISTDPQSYTLENTGIADVELIFSIPIIEILKQNLDKEYKHKLKNQHATIFLGIRFPSGNIDKEGEIPDILTNNKTLPYTLQRGSGTYDLILGGYYIYNAKKIAIGLQNNNLIRLHNNKNNYQLGHIVNATTWFSYLLHYYVSGSVRVQWEKKFNIQGNHANIPTQTLANQPLNPIFQINAYASDQIDVLLGINIYIDKFFNLKSKLALEFGIPVYHRVNGIQLRSNFYFTLNWSVLLYSYGKKVYWEQKTN